MEKFEDTLLIPYWRPRICDTGFQNSADGCLMSWSLHVCHPFIGAYRFPLQIFKTPKLVGVIQLPLPRCRLRLGLFLLFSYAMREYLHLPVNLPAHQKALHRLLMANRPFAEW